MQKTFFRGFAVCRIVVIFYLLTALMPSVGSSQSCFAPPSGIVGWWQGENTANDFIGTNNGSLTNNIGYSSGEVNTGFYSYGTPAGVVLNNQANLQLQNFTIEAWVAVGLPGNLTGGQTTYGHIFGYGSGGYALALDKAG